jgi:hypothetical protein
MSASFSVNWDYRCPFARNAHEHVVNALRGGADWDVEFVPFSLSQVHVEAGDPPVWENPAKAADLLSMQAGIVVRDRDPERFLDAHWALFRARHDESRDLRRQEVVAEVLREAGVDADQTLAAVADGWPLETLRKAHETAVEQLDVWGVPTFVVDGRAAFVRLMTRPEPGPAGQAASRQLIDRVVDAVGGWTEVNELKHTSLDR